MIGGYMSYEFVNVLPNGLLRYRVTYHIFRDCIGNVPLSPTLTLAVYYNSGSRSLAFAQTVPLRSKQIVQPPGTIECPFYRDRVCIEYGVYDAFVDLDESTTGYRLLYQECCRNVQTNLINSGSGEPNQGQVYTAEIPPTIYRNSSPRFAGVPSPFMCALDTTDFLFNAYDKDGDVLSYRFVRPFKGSSSLTNVTPDPPATFPNEIEGVQYAAGYNQNAPFGAQGFQEINNVTGLTRLFAPQQGSYVIGVEVTETRNGVVLGRTRMDLQILVYNCPPNRKPNISNLTEPGRTSYEITAGETLCFDIQGSDPDNDRVFLSADGEVFGLNSFTGSRATFNNANEVGSVSSTFCWTPDCDHDRDAPYVVQFVARDDGCPPKFDGKLVDIKVKPFLGAQNFSGPDRLCNFNRGIYVADFTVETSKIEWEFSGGIVEGPSDEHSIRIQWTEVGVHTIRMREVLPGGCQGEWVERQVTIVDAPSLPQISGEDTVCIDATSIAYSTNPNPDYTFSWFISSNGTLTNTNRNNVTLDWTNPDSNTFIKVVVTNSDGCPSDTGVLNVFISDPNPEPRWPRPVCPNSENVEYQTDNIPGSIYTWDIVGGVQTGGGNTSEITVTWGNEGLGTVSVQETNKFGCVSPTNTIEVDITYDLPALEIEGDSSICEFEIDISYKVISTAGSVYHWNINGGNQVAGDSSSSILVNWQNTGLGRIEVQQIAFDLVNDRECSSPVTVMDVIIHPIPTANEILGNIEICQFSDTIEYVVNGFPNSTFDWEITGDADINNIPGQGTAIIRIFWDNHGSFRISAIETSEFSCIGDEIELDVIVHPKPQTTPIVGPFVICPEDALNKIYSVNGLPNSEYQWWVDGANNIAGIPTNTIAVDWDLTQTFGSVSVLEISEFGCLGDTLNAEIDIDLLDLEMRYVTVGTPDNIMEIYWEIPELSYTNNFEIWTRSEGGNWDLLTEVNGTMSSHIQSPINTNNYPFDYFVAATNRCGTRMQTNPHTNVNLRLTEVGSQELILEFTPYLGWENGVSNYELYQRINDGVYEVLFDNVFPGEIIELQRNDESFRQCYRVKAYENGNNEEESWSNDQCMLFFPRVFIPNAFTPNNDANNETFKATVSAVKSYQMQIFNRWGEKLFATTDTKQGWDGIYQGSEVPQGVYVYYIVYEDYLGKRYQTKGTITLLR
jgi:gliding motility-associated-like protein